MINGSIQSLGKFLIIILFQMQTFLLRDNCFEKLCRKAEKPLISLFVGFANEQSIVSSVKRRAIISTIKFLQVLFDQVASKVPGKGGRSNAERFVNGCDVARSC